MPSISDIIRMRCSCRSYSDQIIEPSTLKALDEAISAPQAGPFGNTPQFVLLTLETLSHERWKKLGTYGVIKNAHLYLAGLIRPAPGAACDYGYCKERLILKATELGLGTCWLGGTFSISAFANAAGLQAGEILPTVTPVGYAAAKPSLTDRLFRGFAGSDSRKPWRELFFDRNCAIPLSSEEAGPFAQALENVRLAPSASNKQPWRIIRDPERQAFHFYLSRSTGYRHIREMSLQEIDMGIAKCHFDLTTQEAGIAGHWQRQDTPPGAGSLEYMATWQKA